MSKKLFIVTCTENTNTQNFAEPIKTKWVQIGINPLLLSVVFKKFGNLFQILGATYERLFRPRLVFRNG